MAKQTVNIGTSVNKGDGDPLRTAFVKINDNFTELYTALGLDTGGLNLGTFEFTGSTITTTDSSAITLDQATTISSNLTVGGDILPSTANGGDLGSSAKPWHSLYVSGSTIYVGGQALGVDDQGELVWNNEKIARTDIEGLTVDQDGTRTNVGKTLTESENTVTSRLYVQPNQVGLESISDPEGAANNSTGSVVVSNNAVELSLVEQEAGGDSVVALVVNSSGVEIAQGDGVTTTYLTIDATSITGGGQIDIDNSGTDQDINIYSGNNILLHCENGSLLKFDSDGILHLGADVGRIWADQGTGKVIIGDAFGAGGAPSMPSSVIEIGGDTNAFRIGRANGANNPSWTFGNDGDLTFPDSTVQTTAYLGITNEHQASARLIVGTNTAVKESLTVRVVASSGSLNVEVNYSDPSVNTSVSAFVAYPTVSNVYSGRITKVAANSVYDVFGNLTQAGDTISFTVTDHSYHKIYRVTITAHEMPGSGTVGEAYCIIETLKNG
jgi:hypothetical protein